MDASKLSKSKIGEYEKCPHRYYCIVHLEIRGEATVPMMVGTIVHEVLARLGKEFQKNGPKSPLIQGFTDDAMSLGRLSTKVNKILDEGFAKAKKKEMPTLSVEALQLCKDLLIVAAVGGNPKKPAYTLFPEGHQILEVERFFTMPVGKVGKKNVIYRGIYDRVDLTPSGDILVLDYKTGEYIPSPKELLTDVQATSYLAAYREQLKKRGATSTIPMFGWLYLRQGYLFTQRSSAALDTFPEWLLIMARLIFEDNKHESKPKWKGLCDKCRFRDPIPEHNYGGCPKWHDGQSDPTLPGM